MMKKILLFMVSAVAMLLYTSCQKEVSSISGNEAEVTFSVIASDMATKAATSSIADGTNIDILYYEIFRSDIAAGKIGEGTVKDNDGNKEFTVTLKLVADQEYNIIFWAQVDGNDHYVVSDLRSVKVKNNDYSLASANDESRAAFFACHKFTVTAGAALNQTVYLKRPFAQLNLGTTTYDVDLYDDIDVTTTTIKVSNVATSFNTVTGMGEGEQKDVLFVAAATPNGNDDKTDKLLSAANSKYYWIGMNYLLVAGNEKDNIDVEATVVTNHGTIVNKIPNVPVQENYRTNILGDFLTSEAVFTVIVDEKFLESDHNIIDPEVEFNQEKLDNLAKVAGREIFVPAGQWNLPAVVAEGVVFVGEDGTVLNVGATADPFGVSGKIAVNLDGTVINAPANALTVVGAADVNLTVEGTVTLNAGADAVEVPQGATLTVSGTGALVAVAGSGQDTATGGSAIGNADGLAGKIVIDGLASINAKGYGKHAFGIGGNGADVLVKNSKVEYAAGGYVQPLFVNDTSYGKSEPEGGAAVGGKTIVIEDSVVEKVDGGSKAAGIGAQYWQSADITIRNSEIKEANGGNASAGIGGSRYAEKDKYSLNILIVDSKVTANGGQFAAGIGAGYDTHCNGEKHTGVNEIQIKGNSVITAKGGQYGAGIGTGYHSAYLTGSIDATVTVNATAGASREKYTIAQNIGYGVVDPNREYKGAIVTFKVGDTVIDNPVIQ